MRTSFGCFVVVCIFGWCHEVMGAVPGEADPDALNHWERRTNVFLKAITYGQGKFVGTDRESIYTSGDGLEWRVVRGGFGTAFDLTFAADRFVVVGQSSVISVSTNVTNVLSWTNVPVPGPLLYGVIHGDGKFVAVGSRIIWLSETLGHSWSNVLWTDMTLWSVAYGAGSFVVVGDGGTTFLSTNGHDWVAGNIGTNTSFYDVLYAQEQFVAVGSGTVIYTSPDGVTWTQRESGIEGAFYNVVHHNGIYVASGVNSVVSSTDGHNWVPGPLFTNIILFTAAAGNNTFFVSGTGPSGTIPPGLWQSSPLNYTEPEIQMPTHMAVPARSIFSVNAKVTGTLPLRFQWYKDGGLLTNATNAWFGRGNASLSDAGRYRLEASNVVGTNASDAEVVVGFGPSIVSPVPRVITVTGATAVISATVTGTPPFTFIWRRPLSVTTAVHTVTGSNDFLRFSPVTTNHAGLHGVYVTNLFGTNLRTGNIEVQDDYDGDGLGDAWESLYGFNTNDASDATLDVDRDLRSNLEEFTAGSDPTNAVSALRITDAHWSVSDGIHFRFLAMSNTTYSIESKVDAGRGSWMRLRDVTGEATNRALQVFDAPGGRSNAIYRVVTPWQP